MATKQIDALINFKDSSGNINEIYPVTKAANVKGLGDSHYTKTELDTKLGNYLPKSGGTMTGALTLNGAPTANLHAATKKYTDDIVSSAKTELNTKIGNYLPKSGGTMTGALTLNGVPTADLHAATKKYVDDNASSLKTQINTLANTTIFSQNDLYMYIMQTHPMLLLSPYKDAYMFDITGNHEHAARTISLSGNAESIVVYDDYEVATRR